MKNLNLFGVTIAALIMIVTTSNVAYAWINGVGSPSSDPKNPVVGTHDRIISSAIYMLPIDLQNKIDIVATKYGTEMPDYNNTSCNCIYGIRDQRNHHVYYFQNETLQDDNSARRAQEEYDLAMKNLNVGDKYNFSIHVGMMSHYISDVSVFGHTMGNNTDWGNEGAPVHGSYENYVAGHSAQFFSSQNITFDGKYDDITAYDATLALAKDTIFDNKFGKGKYTNIFMYEKINNSDPMISAYEDPKFVARIQQSLNYNVNLLADVLHSMLNNTPNGDILTYYRGLGQYDSLVETNDLMKGADNWRNDIIVPGFSVSINTDQLLTLADEWRVS